MGAVFGSSYGWERVNWFAPNGVKAIDDWSFRRSNYHVHVGNEAKNVADNVGVLDLSGFAKCRISGANAETFPDKLVANKITKKIEEYLYVIHLQRMEEFILSLPLREKKMTPFILFQRVHLTD